MLSRLLQWFSEALPLRFWLNLLFLILILAVSVGIGWWAGIVRSLD